MSGPAAPRLSVVVPAYREQDGIAATLGALRTGLASVAPGDALELIVVDDGSDDATVARAAAGGADRVIELGRNRGKGAAVRTGMLAATGDVVVFTDADLQYPPDRVAAVLARLVGDVGAVIGMRSDVRIRRRGGFGLVGGDVGAMVGMRRDSEAPLLRRLGTGAASWLARKLVLGGGRADFGGRLDTQCGLKAFRRDVARDVFSRCRVDRFAFDAEVLLLLSLLGVPTVAETVTAVATARRSSVRMVRDGAGILRDLLRIRRRFRSGEYRIPGVEADA